MKDLRAGPTDDQRQHAEVARARLQEDLKEQIRQKRAREAAAKAVEEAAVRKVSSEVAK